VKVAFLLFTRQHFYQQKKQSLSKFWKMKGKILQR